jgi:hypothetical protein
MLYIGVARSCVCINVILVLYGIHGQKYKFYWIPPHSLLITSKLSVLFLYGTTTH